MKPKKDEFWESVRMNNDTFNYWYYRLANLAISMIEWVNLPASIDPRFLELLLFGKGMAVFFYDDVLDIYLCTNVMIGGEWDVYNIPIDRVAYASNGYERNLTIADSVLIFNNFMHTPSILETELYAKKLYEIDRAIDVNVKGQKTPKIVLCEENQRLTMKNLYQKYDGNQPFIFGNKGLDVNAFQTLDTTAPYVSGDLQLLKQQVFNEYLTLRGIENASFPKRERQFSSEIQSNLGGIDAERNVLLASRKQACEQINTMFGLNIDVKFKSELGNLVPSVEAGLEERVEEGEEA